MSNQQSAGNVSAVLPPPVLGQSPLERTLTRETQKKKNRSSRVQSQSQKQLSLNGIYEPLSKAGAIANTGSHGQAAFLVGSRPNI